METSTNILAVAALNFSLASPAGAVMPQSQSLPAQYRDASSTAKEGSWYGFVTDVAATARASYKPFSAVSEFSVQALVRATTEGEHAIGIIREWTLLEKNWDDEGADAPNPASLRQAEWFVRLISADSVIPEPMLHANGRAGLYWNEGGLYADLEFLGDGRVSYYIERQCDEGKEKHKGVAFIRRNSMPAVFATLIGV